MSSMAFISPPILKLQSPTVDYHFHHARHHFPTVTQVIGFFCAGTTRQYVTSVGLQKGEQRRALITFSSDTAMSWTELI